MTSYRSSIGLGSFQSKLMNPLYDLTLASVQLGCLYFRHRAFEGLTWRRGKLGMTRRIPDLKFLFLGLDQCAAVARLYMWKLTSAPRSGIVLQFEIDLGSAQNQTL